MKKRISLLVLAWFLIAALTGCAVGKDFYEHHPRSEQEVVSTWGRPQSVVTMADGGQAYCYKEHGMYDSPRYFVIQDGFVTRSGTGTPH